MNIELIGLEEVSISERDAIHDMVNRLLNVSEFDKYSINISLVDTDTMIDLCRRFKGKKKITDVLSFPTPEMERVFEHTKNFLGDVVICVEKAREQAEQFGHSLLEEIAVLCAHGLYHLLGLDHEVSEEEASMQMQGEMYLLENAGFSPGLSLIGRV